MHSNNMHGGDPRNLGRFGASTTPNPFYSVANQFIPRNFHDVIRWSRYILTQSPTVAEVIRKFATYPITTFEVHTDDPLVKKRYDEVIKSIKLKEHACDMGVNYHTIGNGFISVYFPVDRFLVCPSCAHTDACKEAMNRGTAVYKNYKFTGNCTKCRASVSKFKVKDVGSTDVKRINLVIWPAEHVTVNFNPITGESEYWYNIPNEVRKKVMLGDPLYVSTTPMEMLDAIQQNQSFLFESGSIFHLKSLNMTEMLQGLGMPPLISMYSSVFHQTLLKRANEAVATEHMTPMRSVFPSQGSAAGDPIAMMSQAKFVTNMEDAFRKHKKDPNHVLISPVPIGYANLGGQGRALMVHEELRFTEETILMGLGVSRELLSGSTNWTSSDVGLRLLENSLFGYAAQIENMAQWAMDKVAGYLGIPPVTLSLKPFQLTDNPTLKHALPQFLEAKLASPSTTLAAFGLDLGKELKNSEKDAVTMAMAMADRNAAVRNAAFMKSQELAGNPEDDSGLRAIRDKAYSQATQIIANPDPVERAQMLFMIKAQDQMMFDQVSGILDDYYEMVSKQAGINPAGPAQEPPVEARDLDVSDPDGDNIYQEPINNTEGRGGINPTRIRETTEPGV